MSGLTTGDIIVIALYFAMMVLVGAYYTRKIKDSDSYAVADRSLTMKIMIGTTVATCMGANAAFGEVGKAFNLGVSSFYSLVAWNIGWIALILMSKRLRASGAYSLPNFLEMRYGKTTKTIAAVLTLVFLINATAAQTAAVGNIFSTFKIMDLIPAIVVSGILIILYTVFGGLYAVAITDTIQAILLLGGVAIAVPIIAYTQAGGFTYVMANSQPHVLDWGKLSFLELLGWILSYMLAAGSHAAYSQRIFASKDEKTAFWGSIWSNIISLAACIAIPLAVFTAPFIFPEMTNGETFVPLMIYTYFPPIAKGLTIAALFGLVLSTADSFLLMVGTTISNDIYAVFNPSADSKKLLKVSRFFTVAGGILGIILAIYGKSVLTLFKTGAAAYGAGMFVPLLLGCFWKDATEKAVNTGMLLGCFGTILWNLFLKSSTKIDGVIIGALLCLISVVAISLSSKAASPAVNQNA